ncbi:MAG TPA: MFS transporter [Candidatus Nanoarchaeia archaeon]|nr:MFS transporter [Candidatus Nanoarchaeia archaeon]
MLNRKVRALLFADTAWLFGEGMLGPLFAVFAQRIGGDILEITWAWAVYLVVAGLLIVVIGRISDKKMDKRKLVFWGYVLNAVLTFGYLLVHDSYSLFVLQIGLGVAAALATPTWDALYSEYGSKKKFGLAWGLSDGFAEIFGGVAIFIGGLVVTYFSFDLLFWVMGGVQVVSVILLYPVLRK